MTIQQSLEHIHYQYTVTFTSFKKLSNCHMEGSQILQIVAY